MDHAPTLTEQVRAWYERSPQAQRAYARFYADVAAVTAWGIPRVRRLRERVGSAVGGASADR